MPESPELKLMSKYINDIVKNKIFYKIEKSKESKNILDKINIDQFKITSESRGKELRLKLNDSIQLYLTMGMSGNWHFSKVEDMKKHSHLRFYTITGEVLCLVDPRRFAKWKVGTNWNKDRGPDSMTEFDDFCLNLKNNIKNKAFEKPISELLMNQKYFNGIGNYIRAEVLYRADIDPFISAKDVVLNKKFLNLLKQVQEESFEIGGGEIRSYKNPNNISDKKDDTFKNWLQCYEKKKKIIDNTGRSFWYDEKWDHRCTYCSEHMIHDESFNEDAEPCHESCLLTSIRFWSDRDEVLDLIGY